MIAYLTQCLKVIFDELKLRNFVPNWTLFLYRFEWIVETDEHVLLRVVFVTGHILFSSKCYNDGQTIDNFAVEIRKKLIDLPLS